MPAHIGSSWRSSTIRAQAQQQCGAALQSWIRLWRKAVRDTQENPCWRANPWLWSSIKLSSYSWILSEQWLPACAWSCSSLVLYHWLSACCYVLGWNHQISGWPFWPSHVLFFLLALWHPCFAVTISSWLTFPYTANTSCSSLTSHSAEFQIKYSLHTEIILNL